MEEVCSRSMIPIELFLSFHWTKKASSEYLSLRPASSEWVTTHAECYSYIWPLYPLLFPPPLHGTLFFLSYALMGISVLTDNFSPFLLLFLPEQDRKIRVPLPQHRGWVQWERPEALTPTVTPQESAERRWESTEDNFWVFACSLYFAETWRNLVV